MRVELSGVAKRYRAEWILKPFNLTLEQGSRTAVTGPNGSGKSTLLRILSGHLSPSKGNIAYITNGRSLPSQEVYQRLTYAAPYIELIEEFTLSETLRFHFRFKSLYDGLSREDVVELLGMQPHLHKQVRFFSSGMKQRLKLALALCSESTLVMLDEPGTNLDAQGLDWYHQLIGRFGEGRTIIVASNVEADYNFCERRISVLDMK